MSLDYLRVVDRSNGLYSHWEQAEAEESYSQFGLSTYHVFLNVQLQSKTLQVYKKLTQEVVSSCKDYAQLSLDHSGQASDATPQYREAFLWYRKLARDMERWASLELREQVLSHEEIKRGLLRHQRTLPASISKCSNKNKASGSSVQPTEKLSISAQEFGQTDFQELVDSLHILLSSRDEVKVLNRLEEKRSQTLIDLLDKVMDYTTPPARIHAQCLHCLRKICGRSGLLPASCKMDAQQLSKDATEPYMSGGFADIWVGRYKNRRVAIKALRVYGKDNLSKVRKSFCREAVLWRKLSHPNILPFLGASTTLFPLCMVCEWMDNGNITTYVKSHSDANRLKLLVDVANGLKYIHSLGVLHGDIKGANILINSKDEAVVSDFGLTAVTYDPNTVNAITTTAEVIGSVRWMAPETIHPDESECRRVSPESDIYAFAMVIWEVFAGCVPYHEYARDATVVFKITIGIRPERPLHATPLGLSDMVWSVVEMCWQEWNKRPRITFVLQCLEEALRQFIPPPPSADTSSHVELADSDSDSDDDPLFQQDFSVPAFGDLDYSAFGVHPKPFASQVDAGSLSEEGICENNTTLVEGFMSMSLAPSGLGLQWDDVPD